jgi:ribonuclease VapC
MIVVDSSALIAILEKEPDAGIYAAAIRQAERVSISAVNVHESGLVLRARHGMAAADRMWRFLKDENDFDIVPFDESQARGALAAFDRYGKGIYSKAGLNLSDCVAYALAKSMNSTLLFKGNDFARTDIQPMVKPSI